MKQKNVQAKAKSSLNGTQANALTKPAKSSAKSPAKLSLAAGKVTKGAKKQVQTPPAKIVPEDDEDSEAEEDDEVEELESDAEQDEEDVEDGDEAELLEEEDDDDDDDDALAEAPINKSPAKQDGGIPKINTGHVPSDMPDDQVIFVKNLPKKFKQIDIVEVFAKFGPIHTINATHGAESSTAHIAFQDSDAAHAALITDQVAQVKGQIIQVEMRRSKKQKVKKQEDKQKRAEEKAKQAEEHKQQIEATKDRTVYVKNLKSGTTEEQVKEHFSTAGTVENVTIVTRKNFHFGFVTLSNAEEADAAKNLHNTILNGATIGVFLKDDDQHRTAVKDEKRTVLLKNNQQLESISGEQLTEIFAKCGEVENIDILCKKHVLAFITYKQESGAKKALKLNGTTKGDLEIEVEEYKLPNKTNTSVFIQNVKQGVTEEEIRELFASTGEVEHVFLKAGFAITKFKDTDGFCKAFLLNESLLQGQMVFIEPYSDKKQHVLKSKAHLGGKRKFPFKGNQQKRFKHE